MKNKAKTKTTTIQLPVEYVNLLKERDITIKEAACYGIELILSKEKMINSVKNEIQIHELQIQNKNKEIELINSSPDIIITKQNNTKPNINMLRAKNFTIRAMKDYSLTVEEIIEEFKNNAKIFKVSEIELFDIIVQKFLESLVDEDKNDFEYYKEIFDEFVDEYQSSLKK